MMIIYARNIKPYSLYANWVEGGGVACLESFNLLFILQTNIVRQSLHFGFYS